MNQFQLSQPPSLRLYNAHSAFSFSLPRGGGHLSDIFPRSRDVIPGWETTGGQPRRTALVTITLESWEDETVHATCPFSQRYPKAVVVGPAARPVSLRFDYQQPWRHVAPVALDM